MRVLIQRVSYASCTVDGQITGKIQKGFCLFSGFEPQDDMETVRKMAAKILKLRIFEDEQGKMNRSLLQADGAVLSISQFTLYASCRKGNRPSFTEAARPQQASALYDGLNSILRESVQVAEGIFGADMKIDLCNDGPVTIWLDSRELGMDHPAGTDLNTERSKASA